VLRIQLSTAVSADYNSRNFNRSRCRAQIACGGILHDRQEHLSLPNDTDFSGRIKEIMMVINDRDVSDERTQMEVISRFFAAYDVYDVEGMWSLHTDDAV
jgi:hypothetical protein